MAFDPITFGKVSSLEKAISPAIKRKLPVAQGEVINKNDVVSVLNNELYKVSKDKPPAYGDIPVTNRGLANPYNTSLEDVYLLDAASNLYMSLVSEGDIGVTARVFTYTEADGLVLKATKLSSSDYYSTAKINSTVLSNNSVAVTFLVGASPSVDVATTTFKYDSLTNTITASPVVLVGTGIYVTTSKVLDGVHKIDGVTYVAFFHTYLGANYSLHASILGLNPDSTITIKSTTNLMTQTNTNFTEINTCKVGTDTYLLLWQGTGSDLTMMGVRATTTTLTSGSAVVVRALAKGGIMKKTVDNWVAFGAATSANAALCFSAYLNPTTLAITHGNLQANTNAIYAASYCRVVVKDNTKVVYIFSPISASSFEEFHVCTLSGTSVARVGNSTNVTHRKTSLRNNSQDFYFLPGSPMMTYPLDMSGGTSIKFLHIDFGTGLVSTLYEPNQNWAWQMTSKYAYCRVFMFGDKFVLNTNYGLSFIENDLVSPYSSLTKFSPYATGAKYTATDLSPNQTNKKRTQFVSLPKINRGVLYFIDSVTNQLYASLYDLTNFTLLDHKLLFTNLFELDTSISGPNYMKHFPVMSATEVGDNGSAVVVKEEGYVSVYSSSFCYLEVINDKLEIKKELKKLTVNNTSDSTVYDFGLTHTKTTDTHHWFLLVGGLSTSSTAFYSFYFSMGKASYDIDTGGTLQSIASQTNDSYLSVSVRKISNDEYLAVAGRFAVVYTVSEESKRTFTSYSNQVVEEVLASSYAESLILNDDYFVYMYKVTDKNDATPATIKNYFNRLALVANKSNPLIILDLKDLPFQIRYDSQFIKTGESSFSIVNGQTIHMYSIEGNILTLLGSTIIEGAGDNPVEFSELGNDKSVSIGSKNGLSKLNLHHQGEDFISTNKFLGKPLGIAQQAGSSGVTIEYQKGGIAKGFTGLSAGKKYRVGSDGTLATQGNYVLGVAISETEILLD